ncbi:CD302 antigen [Oryzias melastigma]|uniref:CD302 antigen n=1 Tax=Oryzias melastigma TaxID=30732 RepID=A0A3B3CY29_ORYME|nr:CD302 antigen [Oryzias melastigma]KAF6726675.1 CD302 antigen [Oryzias melastigma]
MELREMKPIFNSLLIVCFAVFLQAQLSCAGDCPADGRTWVTFGAKCYHFVHGEEETIKSYTIDSAKAICTGFKLLTIHSKEENDFVINYSPQVWKGRVNVWLGMDYDTDTDAMRWFDDKPVTFTNWEYSPYPSDLPKLETCVALHSTSGRWENVSCEEEENGVVCETPQEADQPKRKPNALLSTLVILSVVAVVGVSAGIWFVHQKQNSGSPIFTAFEYHPPFRVPDTDESCLVEAEETDDMP